MDNPRIIPEQWLEWEYERPEGNLSTFAPTLEDAIRTMHEHGFTNINREKVKCTNRLLADVLAKEAL